MSKRHDWRGGQGLQLCGNALCNVRRKSASERGGPPWRYSADGVTWSQASMPCKGTTLAEVRAEDER